MVREVWNRCVSMCVCVCVFRFAITFAKCLMRWSILQHFRTTSRPDHFKGSPKFVVELHLHILFTCSTNGTQIYQFFSLVCSENYDFANQAA